MRINYKRELEDAARTMILVHRPHTLIKLILRMIVRKVKIEHAGILLYEKLRNAYIVTVTHGQVGTRMPAGLIRLDPHSPIIRFFSQKEYLPLLDDGALLLSKVNSLLEKDGFFEGKEELEKMLLGIKFQMKSFDALVCIPTYDRDKLLGILMLGEKVNRKSYKKEEVDFFIALSNDVGMAIRNAMLFEDLQLEIERNKRIFFETTEALAAAIDAKDHYTRGHTARVTEYTQAIAREIFSNRKEKTDEKIFENLRIAGLLHDIGKIGIPEEILNKKGTLTPDERKKINEHVLIGAMILEPIKELDEVISAVKYHHEWYDGRGYPEGLKGDQIPFMAAIIAVADAYDAMTTDRPYRVAMTKDEARFELDACIGTRFHPEIAKAAIALSRRGVI